jgi:hypothetical protein
MEKASKSRAPAQKNDFAMSLRLCVFAFATTRKQSKRHFLDRRPALSFRISAIRSAIRASHPYSVGS